VSCGPSPWTPLYRRQSANVCIYGKGGEYKQPLRVNLLK
jgi:hypothetical protein